MWKEKHNRIIFRIELSSLGQYMPLESFFNRVQTSKASCYPILQFNSIYPISSYQFGTATQFKIMHNTNYCQAGNV